MSLDVNGHAQSTVFLAPDYAALEERVGAGIEIRVLPLTTSTINPGMSITIES